MVQEKRYQALVKRETFVGNRNLKQNVSNCSTCSKAVVNSSLLKFWLTSFQHFAALNSGSTRRVSNIFLELYPRFVFVIYKQGFFSCFRTVSADITATANLDYVPIDHVLEISPFVRVVTITVSYLTIDDDVFEGDETLVYSFSLFDDPSASGNAIAGPAITTFVIVDDDAPRKYSNEEKYFQYNS